MPVIGAEWKDGKTEVHWRASPFASSIMDTLTKIHPPSSPTTNMSSSELLTTSDRLRIGLMSPPDLTSFPPSLPPAPCSCCCCPLPPPPTEAANPFPFPAPPPPAELTTTMGDRHTSLIKSAASLAFLSYTCTVPLHDATSSRDEVDMASTGGYCKCPDAASSGGKCVSDMMALALLAMMPCASVGPVGGASGVDVREESGPGLEDVAMDMGDVAWLPPKWGTVAWADSRM
ncbi:hypothetical protein BCR44DRAFT_1451364 [Catenaria anguillulae PL171]|uniref:Uncharacterized protein n=1 Tax=Catenaria anguillulae PL171 TaxID=765915 RepID=A0A1Y2H5V4_9FUNG|nr:hypothetical protein BCR44DRAFT_1451364 [Catenaria anguillulae PL171]